MDHSSKSGLSGPSPETVEPMTTAEEPKVSAARQPIVTEYAPVYLPPWWMKPLICTADVVGGVLLKARQCLFQVKDKLGRVVPVDSVLVESHRLAAVSPRLAERVDSPPPPVGEALHGSFSDPDGGFRRSSGDPCNPHGRRPSASGASLGSLASLGSNGSRAVGGGAVSPGQGPNSAASPRGPVSPGEKRVYSGRASRGHMRNIGSRNSPHGRSIYSDGPLPLPVPTGPAPAQASASGSASALGMVTGVMPTPGLGPSLPALRMSRSIGTRSSAGSLCSLPSLPSSPLAAAPGATTSARSVRGGNGGEPMRSTTRGSLGSGGGSPQPTSGRAVKTEDGLRKKNRRLSAGGQTSRTGSPLVSRSNTCTNAQPTQQGGSYLAFQPRSGAPLVVGESFLFGDL